VKKKSDKKMRMTTQNKKMKEVLKEDLVLPCYVMIKTISSLHFYDLLFWPASQIRHSIFFFFF